MTQHANNYQPKYDLQQVFETFYDEHGFGALSELDVEQYCKDLLYHILPGPEKSFYSARQLVSIAGESTCIKAYKHVQRRISLFKIARLGVKIIKQEEHDTPETIDQKVRFTNELKERFIRGGQLQTVLAEAIGGMGRSVGIVPYVFDIVYWPLYIHMQYIYGAHPYEHFKNKDIVEKIRFFYRLTVLLKLIHDLGVIHRDIKPDNIMVVDSYLPAILDLTLCKPKRKVLMGGNPFETRLASNVCTPLWASPNMRLNSINAVERDDIFSLMRTMWAIFTGIEPHQISDFDYEKLPDKQLQYMYLKGTWDKKIESQYDCCAELLEDIRRYAKMYSIALDKEPTFSKRDLKRIDEQILNITQDEKDAPGAETEEIGIDGGKFWRNIETETQQKEDITKEDGPVVIDLGHIENEEIRKYIEANINLIICLQGKEVEIK